MARSKKYLSGGIVAVLLLSLTMFGGVFVLLTVGSSSSIAAANPCSSQAGMVNPGEITIKGGKITIDGVTLDKVQQSNAALIAKIGKMRGFSQYSIAIAIATAYQESNLYNLDHGHLDSLGLFQQRPSQGWGTASQILDPVYATNKFYDALAKVKDRDQRPMMDVAKEVQRPDPIAYADRWRWDTLGKTLAAMYAGDAPNTQPAGFTAGCQLTGTGDITADGWTSPLRGDFVITSPFNPNRLHPVLGIYKPHTGTDIGAPGGTPIYAAQAGTIEFAGWGGGYGNYIVIRHSATIQTAYAHLSGFGPGIKKGVTVQSGQLIGYVGTTGWSNGTHLHLETKVDGTFVDPVPFFLTVGIKL